MGQYSEVRSRHLRGLIAVTPWRDRSTIDDLLRLRRFLAEGYHGLAASLGFGMPKQRYPHDYRVMLREISEERYQRELAREREEEASRDRAARERAADQAREREDWLAAGGRP